MIQPIEQIDYNNKIRKAANKLLELPQVEMPVIEMFAPGVYYREIFMPAGTFVIGHIHKTEHFNIVTQGVVSIMVDSKWETIIAPKTFVSKAGVSKMLYIHEDTKWITIHPSDETDQKTLIESIIEDSDIYLSKQRLLNGGINS